MSASGFPADAAEIDEDGGRVVLTVASELYPRDAVYAAVMPLLAKAFVHLDRRGEDVRIEVRPRTSADAAGLRAVLGGLANELLIAASRVEIAKRRGGLIEAVTRRAISGAMGPPSLDDLESFDLDGDGFDDPLGIAESWDRSHDKQNKAGDA